MLQIVFEYWNNMEHKQVIVMRKDLNMRKGKLIAQGAHASMGAILSLCKVEKDTLILEMDERVKPWLTGRFKKICVYVNSEEELLDIHEKAKSSNLVCSLIQDAGLTEFGGVKTYTAVAVGPDQEDRIDLITKHLPLF